jgi:hypothetical protein
MSYAFFAILPDSLFEEFKKDVLMLEQTCGLVLQSQSKEKSNSYNMKGNTYHFSYEKKGKYKQFEKELKLVWLKINEKYPQTQWRGE